MESCSNADASEREYRNSGEESASGIVSQQAGHLYYDHLNTPQSAMSVETAMDHDDVASHYDSLADPYNVGNEVLIVDHHIEEDKTDVVGKLDPTTSSDEDTSYSPASSDHLSAYTSHELSSEDDKNSASESIGSSAIDNYADQLNQISHLVDRLVLLHRLVRKRRRCDDNADQEVDGPKRRKMSDSDDENSFLRDRDEEVQEIDAPSDESSSSQNNALLCHNDDDFEEISGLGEESSASQNPESDISLSESDEGFEDSSIDLAESMDEARSSDGYNTESSVSSLESSFASTDSELCADGDASASDSENDSFGSCFGFRNTIFSPVKRDNSQEALPGYEDDSDDEDEVLLSPEHFLTQ